MILTKETLTMFGACPAGYRAVIEHGVIGKDYDEVIAYCQENNFDEFGKWLISKKTTETFVRNNGKVFTMGTFKVFNPITGQHIDCETEEDARIAAVDVSTQILEAHTVSVVRSLTNEQGDSTWIAAQLSDPVKVV